MKIKLTDQLNDYLKNKHPYLRAAEEAVFEVTGMTLEDLRGPRRFTDVVFARMVFAYLCYDEVKPTVLLASYLNRDHATVLYWHSKHEEYSKYDNLYIFMLNAMENVFKQKIEEYGVF